jgi:hypothetical protein
MKRGEAVYFYIRKGYDAAIYLGPLSIVASAIFPYLGFYWSLSCFTLSPQPPASDRSEFSE